MKLMYVLDRNEKEGIDNKHMGLRYFRDKLYEELREINVEVDQVILDGHDDAIFDCVQELEDLEQTIISTLYYIKHNYNIEMELEHLRHNKKLKDRGWIPAGVLECKYKAVTKIE